MAFSISLWRSSSRRFRYRNSRVLTRRPKLSYCGGGDGDLQSVSATHFHVEGRGLPVAICRDHIIDPELLADLFNAQVQSVSLELFAGHIGRDGSRKTHQAGCLVLCNITPAVPLLSASLSIAGGLFSCKVINGISLEATGGVLTSNGAATALVVAIL